MKPLVDVGKVMVRYVKCVSDEGACRFRKHLVVV